MYALLVGTDVIMNLRKQERRPFGTYGTHLTQISVFRDSQSVLCLCRKRFSQYF